MDRNAGDRQNLTLLRSLTSWLDPFKPSSRFDSSGDTLVANVTSQYSNIVVIMHTVGPVIIEAWDGNPNVSSQLTALLNFAS